jgi:hypothetical protein
LSVQNSTLTSGTQCRRVRTRGVVYHYAWCAVLNNGWIWQAELLL